MAPVTVGAAQIACRPGDIRANVDAHLAAIREAAGRAVELLVFPELSLTDYETDPDTAGLARRADCSELAVLAAAAGAMTVVVGFIEAVEAGERPRNACAALRDGAVFHVHRKLNLPTYGALVEGRHYASGTSIDTFPTPLGPAACLICADTWNPALPWIAALAGAEALVVPVASARGAVADGFDSRDGWTVNLRHAALTYGVPVVMANHCGRRSGLDFWGGSAIVDAFGRVLAEAGEGPELLVARLDPRDGVAARARLPTVRDAAPHLVRDILDDILGRRAASGDPS